MCTMWNAKTQPLPHSAVLGTPPVRPQASLSLHGCREGIHEASVSPRRIWAVLCYQDPGRRGSWHAGSLQPCLPSSCLSVSHGAPSGPSHRRPTKWLPVTQPFSVPPRVSISATKQRVDVPALSGSSLWRNRPCQLSLSGSGYATGPPLRANR